jgi:hypothetical protein
VASDDEVGKGFWLSGLAAAAGVVVLVDLSGIFECNWKWWGGFFFVPVLDVWWFV